MSRYTTAMMTINQISMESFAWGQSDCFASTGRVVQACTGRDFRAAFSYSTREQADTIIGFNGGVEALLRAVLAGCEEVAGSEVNDGDPLLLDIPEVGLAAGIRLGSRAVCRTEKGFTSMLITNPRVLKGWRVK